MANSLQRISGGTGCDIVTSSDSDFVARRGKIYAIVVREDDTQIAYIKEDNNGVINTITDRSWIGGGAAASTGGSDEETFPLLIANELLIPDYPVTQLEVTAGSVMVYYEENIWNHYRR
jgi:hypothetical protein